MWLYKHHTASDIIDLNHETGQWRPVADEEKPKSARVLADLPIRGSYEEVNGKPYFKYWTDDNRHVFRTFDGKVFEICRKLPDGSTIEATPGLHCVIEPAKYADGRLREGMSDVSLVAGDGTVLYTLTYDSGYFLRLYASDFTAAAMVQDLSDWDFFVALKGGIEIFAERAASGKIPLAITGTTAMVEGHEVPCDDLLYCDTGEVCPRSGVWVCIEDMRQGQMVRKNEKMPSLDGNDVTWVWSRER
ncbi:hypothetical protein M8A51_13590 [Schlegelella sp. S2-27]|uniref:Uncharacterized protein n=1 Tax=Caldimonas mangrovi TaxID=2944811 RepID=A0ABT0YPA4_9BURK|nr:hypothetical protein [Caldimonas mangrovi]MCM5680560.1 hypothetical protein [Caldimonas mangrovi]